MANKISKNKLGNYIIEGYSRQFKTMAEAQAKVKELEKSNSNSNTKSSTNGNSSGSTSSSSFTSNQNKINDQEQEDFWNEWTNLQQWMSDNPQELDKLMGEITIFDSHYNTLLDNLNKERNLNLNQINSDYEEAIKKIDLDNQFNEQEKQENIKSLTDSFLSTYEELNYNKELAYKNAGKSIKNAIEETGNISAQNYLKQISNGIIGGNITKLDANQIINSLKESRQNTKDDLEAQEMDLEFQKRRQLKQLESQVGSSEAQGIFNQAQNLNPQNLKGMNYYNELNNNNKSSNYNNQNPYTFGNYTGSINQNFQRQQSFNDLSKQSVINSKSQATEKLNFGYDKSLFDINQSKKTDQVNYLQNQLPYTPYLKSNNGSFLLGNQAKQAGGQSFTQRNKWRNQLGLGTFRVY